MNQKEFIDWNKIESLASILADKVKLLNLQFNSVSTISRGGLVPARLLADRLGIKVILVDKDEIPQDSLFVDDIYDTGKTFAKILPKAKNSDNDFWYVDYENCIATHSAQKPKNQSIRKWTGTIEEFLENHQMKIIAKNESEIKFKPQNSG